MSWSTSILSVTYKACESSTSALCRSGHEFVTFTLHHNLWLSERAFAVSYTLSFLDWCRLTRPDEVYNLGAQSHVQVSFELPQYTAEASGVVSIPCHSVKYCMLKAANTFGHTHSWLQKLPRLSGVQRRSCDAVIGVTLNAFVLYAVCFAMIRQMHA